MLTFPNLLQPAVGLLFFKILKNHSSFLVMGFMAAFNLHMAEQNIGLLEKLKYAKSATTM